MEDPYTRALDSVTVETWLLELRMECYRRHLEDFPNLQSVVGFNDVDLKKLGITNAKDRATMIGSLDKYRSNMLSQGHSSKSSSATTQPQHQDSHIGSLIKRGSAIKIKKLKGLLGSSSKGQQKSKKSPDMQITSPQLSFEEEAVLQPIPEIKPQGDDFTRSLPHHSSLEDLLQKVSRKRYAVENDYVPDPQSSPQMARIPLQRSYTVSEPHPSRDEYHTMAFMQSQTANFNVPMQSRLDQQNAVETDQMLENVDSGFHPNKHLSVVSMESGLGLTCENDEKDDFNRSLPLEQQPWFYGTMGRGEVESLLDEDGDFLVIEDTISHGVYTLSLLWDGRCFHLPINSNEVVMKGPGGTLLTGYKYQFDNGGAFDNIPELIYHHLRYRIPISSEFDGILVNPVSHMTAGGDHTPDHSLYNRRPYGTLPKNFGRSVDSNFERDLDFLTLTHSKRASFRATRSASISPIDSPQRSNTEYGTITPHANHLRQTRSASTDVLVRDVDDEDEASNVALGSMYRDVPTSPKLPEMQPSIEDIPDEVRPRTISPYSTYDVPVPSCHVRSESDDYEVMGSVCIRNTLPPSPQLPRARARSPATEIHYSTVVPKSLRHDLSCPSVQHNSTGVKYAEISFKRSNSSSNSSRADIAARNRAQSVTYVTPRMVRDEMTATNPSPHPFSAYSQLSFAKSSPTNSSRSSPLSGTPKPVRHDTGSYRSPSNSPHSSRPTSVVGRGVKTPQTLAEVPGFLKEFTNEELAMHLTKADAVCFLLAPRPGEDYELWKNRVQELNTDSGVLVGLEVLASKSGEKLWKKLFYRHLSLSQLVTISLVHTTDAVERTKFLKRWIELASLLQNGTYGNLFSFMAVMKGLESPQVLDMKRTWNLLKTHYTDAHNLYEDTLKGMISALCEGASIYAIEQLTVPAIQHLRKLYTDDPCSSNDVRVILEDFTTRTIGLDGLDSIVSHTADLSHNAKKRLVSYSYDALLFDFLMQDCARTHLQNMGTSSDDPLERYRRFNIVLDALMSKLDNP